jgi:hypothetical protein
MADGTKAQLALLWHFFEGSGVFWDSWNAHCVIHGWSASRRADHGRDLEV